MPLHSQLRRFKDGFQHSNWTGKHTCDLMKIIGDDYEPITVADKNAQVMSLISLLIMYATSFEATSDDVDDMEFAYDAYMFLVRNTYDRFRNIDGQIEKLDFNWPRLHAVLHYDEWTKKWGVSVYSDTNISERAHIDTVKVAYRASNKCNTASQIIRYSRRADKLKSLRNVVDLDSHVKRPSGNNRRVISMRALEVALRQPGLLKLTAGYFLAIGLLREQVETLGDLHGKWFLSFKAESDLPRQA
ncbi:BQ5605_C011g06612 [Microbotryum silenes-dioicae]|uniref:BQ5605_C011g06612 protein n=1 Tax=Microbotryum silenes-dioicae TaxID=796604 RepID=A0A2X0LTT3_9BASI|nr:BQ5605_C011g06612 [Microbotryum silenes-dioicae]